MWLSETTCSFLLYKMSYFFYKENWKFFLLKKGSITEHSNSQWDKLKIKKCLIMSCNAHFLNNKYTYVNDLLAYIHNFIVTLFFEKCIKILFNKTLNTF